MDSTTDNSFRTLWGIIKTAGAPDYVTQGTLVDAGDAASLPDQAFADPVNRRYPLTDRANTWVSAGYFAKTAGDGAYSREEHDAVLSRILRASDIYGIRGDVDGMMSRLSDAAAPRSEKKASDDMSCFCDPDHMGYPVYDRRGAEMANDFFSRNAYKYGHERRMNIAKNIMRKCAQYGVEPSEQVRMSSGAGFPNRDVLAEHLVFRGDELMNRGIYKMAAEMCKLAKEICVCSDEDLFRNRNGIFDAISAMDEVTGIDDCYDRKFCAPEELVFDITPESLHEVVEDAVPMGDDVFSAKALSSLPRALFEKVLPKEMVDGMMDGGSISPKKLSVTIISLKSPESSHLRRTIRDYSDGLIDVDENEGAEVSGEIEDGDKIELERSGEEVKVDVEKKEEKDKKEGGKKDEQED